jgi:ribonuclease P protein component
MPGFILLVNPRNDGDPRVRAGYTVTKKIGGAVVRNRLKRRFRALVQALLPDHGIAGADHVLIGRDSGLVRDFAALHDDLQRALARAAK